jgi:phage terminase Nu1 subunit (DNA packaging protein)
MYSAKHVEEFAAKELILMWEAIAYVSSGITLAAFIAAAISWIIKSKSEVNERLIRTAKESDRGELVRNALEFFHVETADLTKAQQFKISLEQIQARGQRFKITTAAICFLAVVAASVAAYAIRQSTPPTMARSSDHLDQNEPLDSGIVGSWESVGRIGDFEFQLLFKFDRDGWFSRRYVADEGGYIERGQDTLNIKAGKGLTTAEWKYAFRGTELLKLSANGEPTFFELMLVSAHGNWTEFTRVGTSDSQDVLAGKWKTSFLSNGANWDWTIEIGSERNYHSHLEADDEGRITTADGEWEMTSNWSTEPIDGSYRVLSSTALDFHIWPFGSLTLSRSR